MTGGGDPDGVFISYRRNSSWQTSVLIRDKLRERGYDVFLDVDSLGGGKFGDRILTAIESRQSFVVVIDPETRLDAPSRAEDWMRIEIVHALEHDRNIVPVMLEGTTLDAIPLPDDVSGLVRYNAVSLYPEYVDAAVARIAVFLAEGIAMPPDRTAAGTDRAGDTELAGADGAALGSDSGIGLDGDASGASDTPEPRAGRRLSAGRLRSLAPLALALVAIVVAGVVVYVGPRSNPPPPPAARVVAEVNTPDCRSVAVSPDGRRVYAASYYESAVYAVDAKTATITARIPLGVQAWDIAVSQDGRYGYVSDPEGGRVQVVDLASNTAVSMVDVYEPDNTDPYTSHLAASRESNRVALAYTNNEYYPMLAIIDSTTNTVLSQLVLGTRGQSAEDVVISPDGRRALVPIADSGSDPSASLAVVDIEANVIATKTPAKPDSGAMSLSPDGRRAYLSANSGALQTFDTATGQEISVQQVVNEPIFDIATTPDGRSLYVASASGYSSGTITKFDVSTQSVVSSIDPVGRPTSMVTSRDGGRLFLTASRPQPGTISGGPGKLIFYDIGT